MADSKITALTALTTLLGTDIFPVVSDPGGTPVTKKITSANIAAYLAALAETLTNKQLTSPKLNENVALTSTSTELNLLHDNLGAWPTFTPAWTNLTAGAGTNVGKWNKIGRVVNFCLIWGFGAGASVSGSITLTLPTAGAVLDGGIPIGIVTAIDSSTGKYYKGVLLFSGVIRFLTVDGTNIIESLSSSTIPFTWATDDIIMITGTYQSNA